jgi:hypothetical protein
VDKFFKTLATKQKKKQTKKKNKTKKKTLARLASSSIFTHQVRKQLAQNIERVIEKEKKNPARLASEF